MRLYVGSSLSLYLSYTYTHPRRFSVYLHLYTFEPLDSPSFRTIYATCLCIFLSRTAGSVYPPVPRSPLPFPHYPSTQIFLPRLLSFSSSLSTLPSHFCSFSRAPNNLPSRRRAHKLTNWLFTCACETMSLSLSLYIPSLRIEPVVVVVLACSWYFSVVLSYVCRCRREFSLSSPRWPLPFWSLSIDLQNDFTFALYRPWMKKFTQLMILQELTWLFYLPNDYYQLLRNMWDTRLIQLR